MFLPARLADTITESRRSVFSCACAQRHSTLSAENKIVFFIFPYDGINRIKFKGCNLNPDFPDTPIYYLFYQFYLIEFRPVLSGDVDFALGIYGYAVQDVGGRSPEFVRKKPGAIDGSFHFTG